MNPLDPTTQSARQAHLEELYLQDGRSEPGHPMHGLYSGLQAMHEWRTTGVLATPCRVVPRDRETVR